MNQYKFFLFNLFILALLVSGCASSEVNHYSVNVISLQDNYDLFLAQAKTWKSDAYLEWAHFSFDAKDKVVSLGFQSPSDDYESVLLFYNPKTQEFREEIIPHEVSIKYHIPIEESDWKLDSHDAVEAFLSYEDILKAWKQTPERCNDLKLRHFYVEQEWVLAWVLTISDCSSYAEYYYLDPITGERLELDY